MTMSTVLLNKERVKILNNSGESYYTPVHIFKKSAFINVYQFRIPCMFQVFM